MQRSSTCNFMYGELTNQDAVKSIQDAFEKQEPVQVELLIYKKSSELVFVNVCPLFCFVCLSY